MKLTTHLHLVLRLRMRGAIPPLLHTSSWRGSRYVFMEGYLIKHRYFILNYLSKKNMMHVKFLRMFRCTAAVVIWYLDPGKIETWTLVKLS